MITNRSPKTFSYLLAGSVVLILVGLFVVQSHSTLIACGYTSLGPRIVSLFGFDYRITSVGIDSIGYYDGCNYGGISTISFLPETLGIVSFLILVSYPATRDLKGVNTRLNTVLVVLGSVGFLLVWFVGYIPGFVLIVFLGFTVVMRSNWGGQNETEATRKSA